MKPDIVPYQLYNYPGIISDYFFRNEVHDSPACPEYLLVFVYSGELFISSKELKVNVLEGSCVFLRKDVNTTLLKKAFCGKSFRSIFIGFSKSFLWEFYCEMKLNGAPENPESFAGNVIQLPESPYLKSIYISMLPYLKGAMKPQKEILEIKLKEAVYGLLLTDKRFYSCLFGLYKRKETDISRGLIKKADKLRQAGMCCVRNWIITRKLEKSFIEVGQGDTASDIYIEVSYKDVCWYAATYKYKCDWDN